MRIFETKNETIKKTFKIKCKQCGKMFNMDNGNACPFCGMIYDKDAAMNIFNEMEKELYGMQMNEMQTHIDEAMQRSRQRREFKNKIRNSASYRTSYKVAWIFAIVIFAIAVVIFGGIFLSQFVGGEAGEFVDKIIKTLFG
jgi:hypothetical protein